MIFAIIPVICVLLAIIGTVMEVRAGRLSRRVAFQIVGTMVLVAIGFISWLLGANWGLQVGIIAVIVMWYVLGREARGWIAGSRKPNRTNKSSER